VTISTVKDSADLFEGDIDYYGSLHYSASGNPERRISLSSQSSGLYFTLSSSARWDIGLSPDIPLDLRVDGGSGSSDIDLSELQLTSLRFDMGSGSSRIDLPATAQAYEMNLNGGSGSLQVSLPAETSLTMHIDSGSGSVNLSLPANAAVRVEVRSSGSGSVQIPARFGRVSGSEKEGVWQTEGYDQASRQINIICDDLGSGSFSIH
jgi:hypothetical protein